MDMLLGQQLLRKTGEVVLADEVLKDKKIIGYYFSAHWCPPCRNFTPILSDFYNVSAPVKVLMPTPYDHQENVLFVHRKGQ